MTAITIVRDDECIAIASDGAAYDDHGIVHQITSKVQIYSHLSMVVASSGSGLAGHYFRDALFWLPNSPQNFDDVLNVAPSLCRDVFEAIRRDSPAYTHMFTLYFCGFSNLRSRMESYGLKPQEWHSVVKADGSVGSAEPFTMVPLLALHCKPVPPVGAATIFGITVPGVNMTESPSDGPRYAMQSVAANRFDLGGLDEEQDREDPFCRVGGFLELTLLSRHSVQSQIVHRWPDEIGERMDVDRGEIEQRAPLWLIDRPQEPEPLSSEPT